MTFRGSYRRRCTVHEDEYRACATGEEMRQLENKRLLLNGIRKPIEVEYDWLTDTWNYSQLIRA